MYPTTPDGRYFLVNKRLWRCSNPSLSDEERQKLVNELMRARRDVKQAKSEQDEKALKTARDAVSTAKVALGERGPVWWTDDSPDYNQRIVMRTPYAQWYQSLYS